MPFGEIWSAADIPLTEQAVELNQAVGDGMCREGRCVGVVAAQSAGANPESPVVFRLIRGCR